MSTKRHPRGTRVKINQLAERFKGQKGTIVEGDTNPDYYRVWVDAEGKALTFQSAEFDAHVEPEVLRITNPDQLVGLKLALNLPDNWIEDGSNNWTERDGYVLGIQVRGIHPGNTGRWGSEDYAGQSDEELHVVFSKDGDEIAVVNLTDLCAWATGYRG